MIHAAVTVLKEQIKHFYLIRRLSVYELKSKHRNHYLGFLWEIINPSIQLLIYWFVFSTILRREPIEIHGEEVPFFLWLLAAFFLWTFFYQATIEGSKSIYSRLRMLSKMNFPLSVIPNYVIFSKFYIHLIMLGITIILFHLNGYIVNIYYLQLLYFIVAAFALIFSISLITSTLSTIVRDVHMLLNAVLRMLLYLSGVLWPLSMLSDWPIIYELLELNPLYYIIEGYRYALFGLDWYMLTHWPYTLVFWGIVLVLFLIGSMLHVSFRRHLIDYL